MQTTTPSSSSAKPPQTEPEALIGPVCGECEEAPAVSHCEKCELSFCTSCWNDIHSAGKLRTHTAVPVPKTVMCDRCGTQEAVVSCDDCGLALCGGCDPSLHQKGARRHHQRTPLSQETKLVSADSALGHGMCRCCNKTAGTVSCQQCQSTYCSVCDSIIHSRGSQVSHQRVPVMAPEIQDGSSVVIPLENNHQEGIPASAKSSSSLCQDVQTEGLLTPNAKSSRHAPLTPNIESALGDVGQHVSRADPETTSTLIVHPASAEPPEVMTQPLPTSQCASSDTEESEEMHKDIGRVLQAPVEPSSSTKRPGTRHAQFIPLLDICRDQQDMDSLTWKVLVAEEGLYRLTAAHHVSQSKKTGLNFQQLNCVSVQTIGLYGNAMNILRWLVEQKVFSSQASARLPPDPGIYCLNIGDHVQLLLFRPTADAFTELSRKNLSCNMLRYLLELCDQVMVFYSGDEIDMFHGHQLASQSEDKRTHKMVMSFEQESEEDVQLCEGFCVELPPELVTCSISGKSIDLADSVHGRALHYGAEVPRKKTSTHNGKKFSTTELHFFFERCRQSFRIVFSSKVESDHRLQLLELSSDDFREQVAVVRQRMAALDNDLQEERKKVSEEEQLAQDEHGVKLDRAVSAHILKHCPIALYFFDDLRADIVQSSPDEIVQCPLCADLLDDPKELPCTHAYCKKCLLELADHNGTCEGNGKTSLECPVCREQHTVDTSALPEANRITRELVEHCQRQGRAQMEMRQKRQEERAASVYYVNSLLVGKDWEQGRSERKRRATDIEKVLATETSRLKAIEKAYVAFSLCVKNDILDQSKEDEKASAEELAAKHMRRLSGFLSAVHRYGEENVNSFIGGMTHSGRFTRFLASLVTQSAKPTKEVFDKMAAEQRDAILHDPLSCAMPAIFDDKASIKAAANIRHQMRCVLVKDTQLFFPKREKLAEYEAVHRAQKESLLTAALSNMEAQIGSCPLQDALSIEITHVHFFAPHSRYSFKQQDAVCFMNYKEECMSAITHVQKLFSFDPMKDDMDKLIAEDMMQVKVQPQIHNLRCNFPFAPESQQLLKLYHLRAGKLLAFIKEVGKDGLGVYVFKVSDHTNELKLPTPQLPLKRGDIEMVDFDEDTRMAAFFVKDMQRVDIYRFDPDWTHWLRRCEIEVPLYMGTTPLNHLVFVPGQEKLCLLGANGLCHLYDIQDKLMKKRTLSIDAPTDRVMASLDGSCLFVFSSEVVQDRAEKAGLSPPSQQLAQPGCTASPGLCSLSNEGSDVGEITTTAGASLSKDDEITELESCSEKEDGMSSSEEFGSSSGSESYASVEEGSDEEDSEAEGDGSSEAPASLLGMLSPAAARDDSLSMAATNGPSAAANLGPTHLVMHVYSLVSLDYLKKVELEPDCFPPDVLPSLRLVMLGPQMHLVALNMNFNSLLSRMIDIRSARSVFRMMDVDRSGASEVHRASDLQHHQQQRGPTNYLEYLYHVYDKFCVEDCLKTSRSQLKLTCVLELPDHIIQSQLDGGSLCSRYVSSLFERLVTSTQKKMRRFSCSVDVVSLAASCQGVVGNGAALLPLGKWLQCLICLVPIQVCRAEQNQLTLFSNGLKSDKSALVQTVYEVQETVRFGLYEDIFDWWTGPVKVISSMGKQSTGKSYMLNHLTGSLFDISGDRCTDGVWLTVRLAKDCLYVVLDFEGLGSLERSEQEDMFLSVMNAAISGLTLFKTEFRVDHDTRNMLSRFRDGVDLIKGDARLLRGWFYINIKDVAERDIKDLQVHFKWKLHEICKEDKNNFLTKMYRGQVTIQTFPTLGNAEFYAELEDIIDHLQSAKTPSFDSGREFKDVLKLLMAKLHMQEWSSFDRTMVAMVVDRLQRNLHEAIEWGLIQCKDDDDEPLTEASGEAVADELLTVSFDGASECPLLDTGIMLGRGRKKSDRDLVEPLLGVVTALRGSRDECSPDVQAWTGDFQDFLRQVCERRSQRIVKWVESHVKAFADDGDVRILQNDMRSHLARVAQDWTLCQAKCSCCFYPCLLLKYHEGEHDCIGSHACHHSCDFCHEAEEAKRTGLSGMVGMASLSGMLTDVDDNNDVMEISPVASVTQSSSEDSSEDEAKDHSNLLGVKILRCGDQAGHNGKHDCQRRSHTCRQTCHLFGKDNCNRYCVKKSGHEKNASDGEHLCNARQHLCGEPCSLPGCSNKCISPYEQSHTKHACRDLACPKKCRMPNCNNKCSAVNNHFHDLDGKDGEEVKHFCGMEHKCAEDCQLDGICEIVSERIIEEKRFKTSMGDEFAYQKVTEQNGSRKKCCIPIPAYADTHDSAHRCTLDAKRIHFCDRRCPSCNYYCTLRYNHDEPLHSTEHGNMRLTYVVSETDSFTVDTRRYGRGDSGEAEMCNFHCKSLGRGHIHIMVCEDGAASSDACTVSEADGKRHQTCKYGPDEDLPKDKLTHEAFWRTIRFRDPCVPEDQEHFKLCPIKCLSEDHEVDSADGKAAESFCSGLLWHKPFHQTQLSQLGGVGHIHSSGHHFTCLHPGSGPLHHVLIVDRSSSMSDTDARPTLPSLTYSHNHRLGAVLDACNQYLTKRAAKARNDLVSFIAFNSSASVLFQGEPLNPANQLRSMTTISPSGGTDFSPVRLHVIKTFQVCCHLGHGKCQ